MLNTLQITTHFTKKLITFQRTHYKEQITTNYKYIKNKKTRFKQLITHKHYKSGM